jgi:hypothetical protein
MAWLEISLTAQFGTLAALLGHLYAKQQTTARCCDIVHSDIKGNNGCELYRI